VHKREKSLLHNYPTALGVQKEFVLEKSGGEEKKQAHKLDQYESFRK
jgi:hypothetical protein